MAEQARIGPASRAPWGMVAMLLIVAAVEIALARRPTNPLADIWADAYEQAASGEVRRSAILCLGDSQIKLGIHAPALGRRLGVSAYNLAVHAGQPAAAEAILRRALEAGARPSALVVGFHPGVLAYEARTNIRQWPEVLGVDACLRLAIHARDARLAAMGVLGIAVPTSRARAEIRRDMLAAARGTVDPAVDEVEQGRRDRRANRGSVVAPSRPAFLDEPGPIHAAAPGSSWRPRPENERAIRRLLAMAGSRGIAVYWVVSPVSPAERARREASGLDAAYDEFLRRIQAEFPGMVVLTTREMAFERSAFVDPVHLDGRGADGLTAAVADALAGDGPSGPRWIVLAPARRRGENPGVARAATPRADATPR